jgi:uncharacterized protein YndB with AHSA1/START domain
MTGPDGDQQHVYWEVREVDLPHCLTVRDGFTNEDGTPNTEMPTNELQITIENISPGRTRMSI